MSVAKHRAPVLQTCGLGRASPDTSKNFRFEVQTCSWKTVIGASCPPAPQSYRCHVLLTEPRGSADQTMSLCHIFINHLINQILRCILLYFIYLTIIFSSHSLISIFSGLIYFWSSPPHFNKVFSERERERELRREREREREREKERERESLGDACQLVASNRATASARRKQFIADAAATLRATLPAPLQRNMDIFSDKGASHWLTVLPVTSHGFSLPKSAFRDALCMRYNWQPDYLPSHCACGQAFSIDYALSCATGGYSVLRHNELRNFTASVMQEVCHDVALEPPLQPLDGELLPSHANV